MKTETEIFYKLKTIFTQINGIAPNIKELSWLASYARQYHQLNVEDFEDLFSQELIDSNKAWRKE